MNQNELIYDLIKEIKDMQQQTLNEITDIKVEQAKQAVMLDENRKDIAYHIRRTDLLENDLQRTREERIQCQAECKVVVNKESKSSVTLKNISIGTGLLLTLTGIIAAIKNLF